MIEHITLRAMQQQSAITQPAAQPDAAHAATDIGADDVEPSGWRDELAFWTVVFAGAAVFALLASIALGARPWPF